MSSSMWFNHNELFIVNYLEFVILENDKQNVDDSSCTRWNWLMALYHEIIQILYLLNVLLLLNKQ